MEVCHLLHTKLSFVDNESVPLLVHAQVPGNLGCRDHEGAQDGFVVVARLRNRRKTITELRNHQEVLFRHALDVLEGHTLLVFIQDLASLSQLTRHDLVIQRDNLRVIRLEHVESVINDGFDPCLFVQRLVFVIHDAILETVV